MRGAHVMIGHADSWLGQVFGRGSGGAIASPVFQHRGELLSGPRFYSVVYFLIAFATAVQLVPSCFATA